MRGLLEHKGPSLKYDAFKVPRFIWISPSFAKRHRALTSIVREAGVVARKWKESLWSHYECVWLWEVSGEVKVREVERRKKEGE